MSKQVETTTPAVSRKEFVTAVDFEEACREIVNYRSTSAAIAVIRKYVDQIKTVCSDLERENEAAFKITCGEAQEVFEALYESYQTLGALLIGQAQFPAEAERVKILDQVAGQMDFMARKLEIFNWPPDEMPEIKDRNL